MNGNSTVKLNTPIPASWVTSVGTSTPTAISGTPTSCNVRVGITDTGQEVVADVDLKAQQNSTATIVASFARYANTASNLFVQVTTSGGTSSAGTIYVAVTIHPQ